MKNKFTLIILFVFSCKLFISQDTPKPEFFGVYMVINNQLVELTSNNSDSLSGVGFLDNSILGLKELKSAKQKWIADENLFFIVYNQGNTSKPTLSKLDYKKSEIMKNSLSGNQQTVDVNMYVPSQVIRLKVAPIEGLNGAFKYIPETPLKYGIYCFDLEGRINTNSSFSFTNEANSKNNVWDFIINPECLGVADLSEANLNEGQYTIPKTYGLWFIDNEKFTKIPVYDNSNLLRFKNPDGRGRYNAITKLSGIKLSSSSLQKHFVTFSGLNLREQKGINYNKSFSEKTYKDMIPEKMYLEKLKQIEIDTRSKKEIKNNEPPKMEKVWIAEKMIPFKVSINFYDGRICKVFFEEKLEPGIYSFSNGGLNTSTATFGFEFVVYTFEVE